MSKHRQQLLSTALSLVLIALPGSRVVAKVEMAQSRQEVPVQTTKSDAIATPQSFVISRVQQTQVIKWIKQNQSSTTGVLSIVVVLYLGVLALRPTWLLWLPSELQIPKTSIKLTPSLLLWLKYRPRVLDAWVNERIQQAQETFEERPTVRERKIHIPIPIRLNANGAALANLSARDLQAIFTRQSIRLLILGEGGVGKTSLACQIAKWAMAPEKTERLCKHRMLPVLIEEELEAAEGKAPLLEAIARQIKNLRDDEKPIPEELLKQLLEKRRILVIVDHLSEMSEATRKAVRLRDSSSPVNALVVTSRIEEILGKEVTHATLKPLRVSSNRLAEFMHEYLKSRGKRDLFDDPEYFDALRRLSQIVTDERDITVLFAKLYADQMIAIAEGSSTDILPNNVPDLILGYINELNRNVTEGKIEDEIVQRDAKVVAWECLNQSFKPEPAEREQVINSLAALEGEGETAKENVKKRLKYLEDRLSLIRTVPPKTKIRFVLDPLAEYLASMYLIELYSEDEQAWQLFLTETRNKPGRVEETKGFLLAIRDCCNVNAKILGCFPLLTEEISELIGLDPEVTKQEKSKKRIQFLIYRLLMSPDANDRFSAGEELWAVSSEIRTTEIPSLIKALRDKDPYVRSIASEIIGNVGRASDSVMRNLLENFNNKEEEVFVRASTAIALTKLGHSRSELVLKILPSLQNESADVRKDIIELLEEIGSTEEIVSTLSMACNDEDESIREYAERVLRRVQKRDTDQMNKIELPVAKIVEFCDRWHITEFALFGSILRDDFRPDSDVDVLVTFAPDTQRGLSETLQMKDELQSIFGRKVDFIVKAAIERSENWLRRKNILESAQIVYAAR